MIDSFILKELDTELIRLGFDKFFEQILNFFEESEIDEGVYFICFVSNNIDNYYFRTW